MHNNVLTNRFIVSSFKRYAGFYQQLLNNVSDYQQLGNLLIQEAEAAICFRQLEQLREIGKILSNMSIKEYQTAGHFYLSLYALRTGENAPEPFNSFIESSSRYKPRAFISLATIEARKGNYETELRYYFEALKYSNKISTRITALRGIALVKAKEGYHPQSLKDLEAFLPMAQYAGSFVYTDFLNSFAVELGEAGRVEEARNVTKIVLASPYAFAYPEWRETSNDIALRGYKSRSVISFTEWNIAKNVLYLPESSREESTQDQPGTVIALDEWKKKMVKEPNGEDELPENMSRQDMAMKILEVITKYKDDEDKLRQLLEYTLELFSGPNKPSK